MKRTVQTIYIILFIGIIGVGTVCNFPKLYKITKDTVHDHVYEAWAILIGLEYSEAFFDKYFFVNANGFFHKVLGQRKVKDVVKVDSGQLTIPLEETPVWQQAEGTSKLYAWLEEEGIPFCYVQAPYEICKENPQLPKGILDYSNKNADVYLSLLKKAGVPVLDLREEMHACNMDHYESFFATDHHWKIETAFWAYGVLTERICKELQEEVPVENLQLEAFRVETAHDKILGSNGRRTGIAYAGLEDITLIYPKEKIQVSFAAPEEGIFREGDFRETYMVYERLEGDNLYEMAQYDIYIGEDYPTTSQIYEEAPVEKKILLIKDSYFRPVQAFLGTVFTQTDTIDMRYFTGDVKEYIRETNPDMVLLCYNPYMLLTYGNFRFVE